MSPEKYDYLEQFLNLQVILNVQFRQDTSKTLDIIVTHLRDAGSSLML